MAKNWQDIKNETLSDSKSWKDIKKDLGYEMQPNIVSKVGQASAEGFNTGIKSPTISVSSIQAGAEGFNAGINNSIPTQMNKTNIANKSNSQTNTVNTQFKNATQNPNLFSQSGFDFAGYVNYFDSLPSDERLDLIKKDLTPEAVAYKYNPQAYGEIVNNNFKKGGLVGSIFSGISKGFFGITDATRGIMNTLSGLVTGKKDTFKGDPGIQAIQNARAKEMEKKSFVENIPENISQIVTQMAPSIVTGGVPGLFLAGTQAGGLNAQQALDEGASPKQALLYGGVTGTAEGVLEKFGFIPGLGGNVVKGLTGVGSKNIRNIAEDYLKRSAVEGLEEVAMEPIQNIAKGLIYDDKISFNPLKKETYGDKGILPLRRMAESGALGFIAGNVLGGVQVPAQITAAKQIQDAIGNNFSNDIRTGLSLPQNSQSYKMAQSIGAKGLDVSYDEYSRFTDQLKRDVDSLIQNEVENMKNQNNFGLKSMSGQPKKTFKVKNTPQSDVVQFNNEEEPLNDNILQIQNDGQESALNAPVSEMDLQNQNNIRNYTLKNLGQGKKYTYKNQGQIPDVGNMVDGANMNVANKEPFVMPQDNVPETNVWKKPEGVSNINETDNIGRNGKNILNKWARNEYVNADLNDGSQYSKDFIEFFNRYYKAGHQGARIIDVKTNDLANDFPPFLEQEFYNAGINDAKANAKREAKKSDKQNKQENPKQEPQQTKIPTLEIGTQVKSPSGKIFTIVQNNALDINSYRLKSLDGIMTMPVKIDIVENEYTVIDDVQNNEDIQEPSRTQIQSEIDKITRNKSVTDKIIKASQKEFFDGWEIGDNKSKTQSAKGKIYRILNDSRKDKAPLDDIEKARQIFDILLMDKTGQARTKEPIKGQLQQEVDDENAPTYNIHPRFSDEIFTDTKNKLYREVGVDRVESYFNKDLEDSMYGASQTEIYVSKSPELALGQKNNTGIMLEFNSENVPLVKINKPINPENGEYLVDDGRKTRRGFQEYLRNNLVKITVRKELIGDVTRDEVENRREFSIKKARFNNIVLNRYLKQGWNKRTNSDGSITFEKAEQTQQEPKQEQNKDTNNFSSLSDIELAKEYSNYTEIQNFDDMADRDTEDTYGNDLFIEIVKRISTGKANSEEMAKLMVNSSETYNEILDNIETELMLNNAEWILEENKNPEIQSALDDLKNVFPEKEQKQPDKLDVLVDKMTELVDAINGKGGVKNDNVDENSRRSVNRTESEATQETATNEPTGVVSGGTGKQSNRSLGTSKDTTKEKSSGRPKTNESDSTSVADTGDSERIRNERTYDVSDHRAGNYRITPDDILAEGGKKTRFKNNISAIKLVKKLEEEGRRATPEEQKILIKYVGWGGLKEVFSERWNSFERKYESDKPEWEKEYNELKSLLTQEEYRAAQSSMLNAHYTRPEMINTMYDISRHLGFKGGKILEPSAGIGHFMGLLPDDMVAKSSFLSVEKDKITGLIAKYLYPDSKVRISGFENVKIPDNYFDMAISNVPFGDIKIYDRQYDGLPYATDRIHNYFFIKSLDKVKEGGLVIFITSTGTMDTSSQQFRQHIKDRADLVGAFRLPSDTFKDNAGTEVTTDLIILRKKVKGEMSKSESFLMNENTNVKLNNGNFGTVNEYYISNPENVLGKYVIDKLTGGRLGVESDGNAMLKLREAIGKLPQNIYKIEKSKVEELTPEEEVKAIKNEKENSYVVKGDQLYQSKSGKLVKVTSKENKNVEKVKELANIKSIVKDLIALQSSTSGEVNLTELQSKLNKAYDNFVKKHGFINNNAKGMRDDPEVYLLEALEMELPSDGLDPKSKPKYKKADIFSKRVITPYVRATKANNASEALAIVMYEDGFVNLQRIAQLVGISENEVTTQLQGKIFDNPQGTWELESEYLSGNVKDKLIRAREAAELDPRYDANVIALEAVQPVIKPYGQFKVTFGSGWIPADDMESILSNILNTNNVNVSYSRTSGKWNVEVKSNNVEVSNLYVGNLSPSKLITKYLNKDKIEITYRDSEGKTHLDVDATNVAKSKARELEQKFFNYLNQDMDMQAKLEKVYNDTVNVYVERQYKKQDKKYIGMSNNVTLRPHQVQAVERTVYGGNVLLAHDVGFGKTFIMLTAAMELKRLGIAKKPVIIMPNNKLTDFRNDMIKLYPQAKILAAETDDFKPENIKGLFAKIATNDWDCVMIRHSSFEKIPVSQELQEAHIEEQIADLRLVLTEAKQTGAKKFTQSQIQNRISNLQAKLISIRSKPKYEVVTFEEMGIDYLLVDEAHYYKNLAFATTKGDVKGVSAEGANKTEDFYIKAKYIQSLHGGKKGIVFATGTPVTNALNELFTMFKYLRPDILETTGTESFDGWVSVFGAIESKPEVKTGGVMSMVERFRSFHNLDELFKMFKEFADMKYDAKELGLNLPNLKNGKPTIVEAESHPEYDDFVTNVILRRIQNMPKGMAARQKGADNALAIGTTARQATADMRLVSPTAKNFEGSKVSKTVKNVLDVYNRTKDYNGTQLIFFDRATSDIFDANMDIFQRLVSAGIPKEEIAFANKYDNEKKLQKLFSDMNSGRIRILIGTYAKMSTGLNVQERLAAIHEVDTPDRPSDILQAEGRMMRQGNKHAEWGKDVEIFRYVITGRTSYDAVRWQMIETKIKAINKLMKGEQISEIEADEDAADSAEKEIMIIKAKALGDDRVIRQIELQENLPQIEADRNNYYAENNNYKRILRDSPIRKEDLKNSLANVTKDIEQYKKYPTDIMEFIIDGEIYKQAKDERFKKDEESPKKLAGEAIKKALEKSYFRQNITKIGTYRGFTLYGKFEKKYLFFKNNFDGYGGIILDNLTTSEGLIDRIEREIDKRIISEQSFFQKEIIEVDKNIKIAENKVTDKPFAKEEQYQEMRAEKDLIDFELENNVPLSESKTKYKTDIKTLDEVEAELAQNVIENLPESELSKILGNERGAVRINFRQTDNENISERIMGRDVADRWNNAVVKKLPLMQRIKERLSEMKKNITRGRYSELERGSRFAELRFKLLQFAKGKDIALTRTLEMIQGLTVKMKPKDYELFNMKVVFMDLLEDAKDGKALPFGLRDEVQVQEILDNIDAEIKGNNVISEALEKRSKLWDALKNEYINAMERIGFKVDDRFKKQNYFRHLVIEYVQADRMLTGTGKKLKTPRNAGYLKRREGSEKDIVKDYIASESEVMAQMLYDIERARLIKYVDTSPHNIKKTLKKQAKEINDELMEEVYNNEASDGEGGILLDDKLRRASPTEKLMKKYASYMAMSFSKLEKMQEQGNLWKGENGEFANVSFSSKGNIDETNKLFKYLSELSKQEEVDGNIEARTILKYHKVREQLVQETLGSAYRTWENIIPEGYDTWQPTKGNAMYMTYSVPENIAEQLVNSMVESVIVDKKQLQKVLVQGMPYSEMVLPDEVIATLDNLVTERTFSAYAKAIQGWKIWQLLSPRRFIKYNLRNISGDLDKIFLGNFGAVGIKNLQKAIKDLALVMYKGESLTGDIKDFFMRGGLSSFLQAQEMGQMNQLKMFLNTTKDRDFNIFRQYWKQVRLATDFREGVLRYATYLSFLDELNNNNGKAKRYVASLREEVEALKDYKDRAYMLANDLLGAYDDVSPMGINLSDKWMPFYRFTETNFKGYFRAVKNAMEDNKKMVTLGRASVSAGVKVPAFIARNMGRLIVGMLGLSALLEVWNNLFFGDEEDELPEEVKKRVHIIIGRDDNGRPIYFTRLGAISDLLEWFGLGTATQDVKDLLNGKKTLREQLEDMAKAPVTKVVNSILPFEKMGAEFLTGLSLFPDPFKPKVIRDRGQYLANSFGLTAEYNAIFNKPSRGYSDSFIDFVFYKSDPRENAYYSILNEKLRFRKAQGERVSSTFFPDDKANALYNYKLSLRYKDKNAADKYLNEYLAYGGTKKGYIQSIKSLSPTGGLGENRDAFIKSLSPDMQAKLDKAEEFYKEMLNSSEFVPGEYTNAYIEFSELRSVINAKYKKMKDGELKPDKETVLKNQYINQIESYEGELNKLERAAALQGKNIEDKITKAKTKLYKSAIETLNRELSK